MKNFCQEHKKCVMIVLLWSLFAIFHCDTIFQTIENLFAILKAPQIAIFSILITIYCFRHQLVKLSRPIQVLLGFAASLLLLEWLMWLLPVLQKHWFSEAEEKLWENKNFGTAIVAFVSAPVAFVLWHFRDENQRNDIESKRKDVNLKEFQKISEWVMGAHFGEAEKEKHSEKFSGSLKNDCELSLTERSREYHIPTESKLALHTFSKKDGAVGLQIAAVYNLLPFYRGDYGKDFEKPALHLLLCAWRILQNDILQKLQQKDLKKQKALIAQLRQRANSPLGQAITRVLLACDKNQPLLNKHPEVFFGLCLIGMNFNLQDLEQDILRKNLFIKKKFINSDLRGIYAQKFEFCGSSFNFTNFSNAMLENANFSDTTITWSKFINTDLALANFTNTQFLSDVKFLNTNLYAAKFVCIDKFECDFTNATISKAQFFKINTISPITLPECKSIFGCLIDLESFKKMKISKSDCTHQKGNIILLYLSQDRVTAKKLKFNNIKLNREIAFKSEDILFPIDSRKTQRINPNWSIE